MENLLSWWQHIPEHLNPVAFRIGPFGMSYYALAYICGFGTAYILVLYRLKSEKWEYSLETVQDGFLYGSIAAIIGGRLGYVALHHFRYFMSNPLMIICPFDPADSFRYTGISGMAFYGALTGVLVASMIFCRVKKINYLRFMDLFTPAIPIGYALGRIANFINGEFYGRITDMPWGMYFPSAPTRALRHPSQLYEAIFEGVVLFVILWSLRNKRYFDGFVSGAYLVGYGAFRFLIEFTRQPDHVSGLIGGFMTIGQVFCIVLVLSGCLAMYFIGSSSARIDRTATAPSGRIK